jgi:predicted esterase
MLPHTWEGIAHVASVEKSEQADSMSSYGCAICIVTATTMMAVLSNAVSQPRAQPCSPDAHHVVECIKPSETDPAIRRFDTAHYIVFNRHTGPQANLLVFLPGTGGEPPGPVPFLKMAADAGYRVISLAYNDVPAVAVYCPRKPDPACSEEFRRMRIYGDGTSLDPDIDNTRAESIVNRFVKLLQYLDRHEPARGWAGYLANGAPNWSRIALAGQSQGAGMAAFIAKQHAMARVILFSSPWDFVVSTGNERRLASWIAWPAKTPPDRWFGGYHERENMARLIAQAYADLQIPTDHIRVFRRDLPTNRRPPTGANPYHGQGIRNPDYAEQRAIFLGHSP